MDFEDSIFNVIVKLVMLGESGVGKTNIYTWFVGGEYDENTMATIGMDYASIEKLIKDQPVRVQLWDTAGSEKYRSIIQSYYSKTNGVVLVYDVSSKESFLLIKNWLDQIWERCADSVKIILIGNKIDLIDKR